MSRAQPTKEGPRPTKCGGNLAGIGGVLVSPTKPPRLVISNIGARAHTHTHTRTRVFGWCQGKVGPSRYSPQHCPPPKKRELHFVLVEVVSHFKLCSLLRGLSKTWFVSKRQPLVRLPTKTTFAWLNSREAQRFQKQNLGQKHGSPRNKSSKS